MAADEVRVNAHEAFNTAHVVANHAQELHEELQRLTQEWANLSHGWQGVAASAYTQSWEEWQEGARKIVDVLSDEAEKLARAAAMYDETDSSSAHALNELDL
ncbi:transcriptional regulator, Fis family [Mycolicibacterium fortuitum subsp. acetamidolyticum]|uniref:ESAT-6-like protein n=1 Tax=Mycolicibacterium fortuitum subsp. acetamidolyticum TaxID=144550 RepID=A0A100WSM3_MYCFO|nr:WXG100 family type VII secretion target [Mycolicibacterium fortuitum]MCV7143471.1 WXG100 family type VII secretion target [Mycolicibacterium fortuitum]OBG53734.1 hypothetical protein A5669_21870 [Mycolicibacterium fortuitum]GAT03793.1 transcriptional regulator, Fis family [Mycolicibacterium fortuitum subsp. acetamidolyticum]